MINVTYSAFSSHSGHHEAHGTTMTSSGISEGFQKLLGNCLGFCTIAIVKGWLTHNKSAPSGNRPQYRDAQEFSQQTYLYQDKPYRQCRLQREKRAYLSEKVFHTYQNTFSKKIFVINGAKHTSHHFRFVIYL